MIRGGRAGCTTTCRAIQGYLAPPIFVVFFLGVFWKRLNGRAAWRRSWSASCLGLFRLAVDTPVTLGLAGFENGYTEGSFLWIVNNIYFQYYSLLIFLVCAAVMVLVSHMTEAPSEAQIKDLTFQTMSAEHRRESRASWGSTEVVWSGVVLVLIMAAYLYFTG